MFIIICLFLIKYINLKKVALFLGVIILTAPILYTVGDEFRNRNVNYESKVTAWKSKYNKIIANDNILRLNRNIITVTSGDLKDKSISDKASYIINEEIEDARNTIAGGMGIITAQSNKVIIDILKTFFKVIIANPIILGSIVLFLYIIYKR